MAQELRSIEISNMPELLALAREVGRANEPAVLRADREDIAFLVPAKAQGKRIPKGRATSADDPIWNIVGIGDAEHATDVSANVDEYLAEAYLTDPR